MGGPPPMSYVEGMEAEERGRSMAEAMVSSNPDAKARVESKFGVAYCRRRYPKAYQEGIVDETSSSGA